MTDVINDLPFPGGISPLSLGMDLAIDQFASFDPGSGANGILVLGDDATGA
ncbi:MAG: hypothetical protein GY946_28655, partial [bacterium]|nr:hypothetical protein [bacterium]